MNINPASSVWLARELKTSARKTVSTHKNALFQKSAPIRARRRDRVTPAGDKTYNRVQRRTTCESVRLVHAARHGDIINRLSPWQRIIYYIISCITSYLQKRSEIPTSEWKASEFWEKCRFCEIKCEMYKVKFWRRKKLLDSGTLLFCTYSIISHFIFSHSVSHVECSSGPGTVQVPAWTRPVRTGSQLHNQLLVSPEIIQVPRTAARPRLLFGNTSCNVSACHSSALWNTQLIRPWTQHVIRPWTQHALHVPARHHQFGLTASCREETQHNIMWCHWSDSCWCLQGPSDIWYSRIFKKSSSCVSTSKIYILSPQHGVFLVLLNLMMSLWTLWIKILCFCRLLDETNLTDYLPAANVTSLKMRNEFSEKWSEGRFQPVTPNWWLT